MICHSCKHYNNCLYKFFIFFSISRRIDFNYNLSTKFISKLPNVKKSLFDMIWEKDKLFVK